MFQLKVSDGCWDIGVGIMAFTMYFGVTRSTGWPGQPWTTLSASVDKSLQQRRPQTKVLRGTPADKTSREPTHNVPHKPRLKAKGPSKGRSLVLHDINIYSFDMSLINHSCLATKRSPDHHEHVLSDTKIVQQGPCATQGPITNAPTLFCSLGHRLRMDCVEKGHSGANSKDQTTHAKKGTNSPFKRYLFSLHHCHLVPRTPSNTW